MAFNRAEARKTSIIEFRHVDGSLHGGIVHGTRPEEFAVVSGPRYGDTKGRWFRYDDVVEVLRADPREYVHLPTFGKLMKGVL